MKKTLLFILLLHILLLNAQENNVVLNSEPKLSLILGVAYNHVNWANGNSNYKPLQFQPLYKVGLSRRITTRQNGRYTWNIYSLFQAQNLIRPNDEGKIGLRNTCIGSMVLMGNGKTRIQFGLETIFNTGSWLQGKSPGRNTNNIHFTAWNVALSAGLNFSVKKTTISVNFSIPIRKIFTDGIPDSVILPEPNKYLPSPIIWRAKQVGLLISLPLNLNK